MNRDIFVNYSVSRPLILWREVECTGDLPSPRSHHASCLVDYRYMYIVAGREGTTKKNDIYYLDILTKIFYKVETTGTKLPAMYGKKGKN